MEPIIASVALVVGLALGALAVRQMAKARTRAEIATLTERLAGRERELDAVRRELDKVGELTEANARLMAENEGLRKTIDAERKAADEKLALLQEAKEALRETFKALSSDTLKANNEVFLNMAKTTLKPIQDKLEHYDKLVRELEKSRREAYGSLQEQLKSLIGSEDKLRSETGKLAQALRNPNVRGHWGELQLERVVELAGMLEYCDFEKQVSVRMDDGSLRPDLVVRLPGGQSVIVDAKTPLDAYLNYIAAQHQSEKEEYLTKHAEQVRAHMKALSSKGYWEQFQPAPEFVVMFLPGESIYSAALQKAPELIQESVMDRVLVAGPTTLIALLRAVAYGWRKEQIAENAQKISNLGRELYERISTMAGHFERLGKSLDGSVRAYNEAIGSLEGRVLPSARHFKKLGVTVAEEMPEIDEVDRVPRELHAPEFLNGETPSELPGEQFSPDSPPQTGT